MTYEEASQALQDHMEQHHGVCLSASQWDAAIAVLRQHLVPRTAGDDGELVGRLRKIGERVPVVCPDGIKGCLVFHFRVEVNATCDQAADRIEALTAENERLRKENDIRQGRIDRLEKLHSDIIAYAARGDTQ